MMQYFSYLTYLLLHKWYVLVECTKEGILWRGLMHDMSKFLPSEFFPYANFFFDKNGQAKIIRDKTGYFTPYDMGDQAFIYAWFLHQKRNKHHWQWYCLPTDNGRLKILEIPHDVLVEMICDWKGAGKAQGTPDTLAWYIKNRDSMQIHPKTRAWIDVKLGYKSKGVPMG